MTRKQAKRRKQKPVRRIRIPALPVKGIALFGFALAIVALSYRLSAEMLDRPITSIMIDGPFQRVTALQIEEAISDELGAGFFTADLASIREQIVALPWIDEATVARRWPGTLTISVSEQIPAAIWGDRGLLNTRGDLFVEDARHIPAELPKLRGPDGQSSVVAQRYLDMREQLIPSGLDVREVTLDARGAWLITLSNGVEIRLGRRNVDEREQLFLDVAANIVASRETEIEFVDMRYSNGFTIGWKDGSRSPVSDADKEEGGMLAGLRN
jgi:cell division protein FtsQ